MNLFWECTRIYFGKGLIKLKWGGPRVGCTVYVLGVVIENYLNCTLSCSGGWEDSKIIIYDRVIMLESKR